MARRRPRLTLTLADAWQGLGHRATGERRARMERSPQWKDGAFENPEPIVNLLGPMMSGAFNVSPDAEPREPIDALTVDPQSYATPPESGLRVTWFGHSSTLIEVDGLRILTDPMWSERVSPLGWVGPKRWYGPLILLAQLPHIDAVLTSHDHYDHLDHRTLIAMKDWDTHRPLPSAVALGLAGCSSCSLVHLPEGEAAAVAQGAPGAGVGGPLTHRDS